jgi:hypothetical protein
MCPGTPASPLAGPSTYITSCEAFFLYFRGGGCAPKSAPGESRSGPVPGPLSKLFRPPSGGLKYPTTMDTYKENYRDFRHTGYCPVTCPG